MATPNYMLSGLERELELYMGEEFEDGNVLSVSIPATVVSISGFGTKARGTPEGTPVKLVFSVQKDDRTKGTVTLLKSDDTQLEQRALTSLTRSEDGKTVSGKWLKLTVTMKMDTSGDPAKLTLNAFQVDMAFAAVKAEAEKLSQFAKNESGIVVAPGLEFEGEYEAGGPTNVYEKILVKVDYIKDSGLTRKPVQNTPVEITFDYDLRRKRLTLSARQLDIQYVYDVKDLNNLKGNSTGTIVWGRSRVNQRTAYMKLEIGTVPYLTVRAFRTETPTTYGDVVKDDGYYIEGEQEAQKLRNMFLALLKAGEMASLDQELDFEFDDDEFELDGIEENDEFEYEHEDDGEPEYEYELENEFEDDGVTENFARRLHELSSQSFESEYELDEEIDRALDAVENEFMVKRLHRKKKRGKRKGLFKKILSAGAKIAGQIASKTPVGSLIKAGTSLVRGDVKGALGNLAKAAVGTALGPAAGTVATTAIDALGGGGEEGGEEGEVRRGGRRRRALRRVAQIARDTYREVADTLPEDFDHPLVANEVANKAVRKAMIKNGVRPSGRAADAPQQRRIIQLRPGEKVVIVRS